MQMLPICPKNPDALHALDAQDTNCMEVIEMKDNDMLPMLRPVAPIQVDGGVKTPELDLQIVLSFIESKSKDPLEGMNPDEE